jgi:hypothetical protein
MSIAVAVRWLWSVGIMIFAAAVLAGCAAESPEQLAAKNRLLTSYPPPGEARIWFFGRYYCFLRL